MVELALKWSFVAPAMVGAAFLFISLKMWRRARIHREDNSSITDEGGLGQAIPAVVGQWGVPSAMTVGYAMAHLGLRNNWVLIFPPTDARQWILYFMPIVLVASVLKLILESRLSDGARRLGEMVIYAIVFAMFFFLLLRPFVLNSWEGWKSATFIGGLTIAGVVLTGLLETASRRMQGFGFLLPTGVYVASCAAVFALLGSISTAMQTGSVATLLGVLFLAIVVKRERWSVSAVVFPMMFLLLVNGCEVYFFAFSENPIPPLALLASFPIVMWIAIDIWPTTRRIGTGWICGLVLTGVILLPTGAAGWFAWRDFAEAAHSDPYADFK